MMNYRKVINGKKVLKEMAQSVKDTVLDGGKKVQEYAETQTGNFAQNARDTMANVKEAVSGKVKEKLANEFRKNYHSYAIDYVDNLIIQSSSAGIDTVDIVKFDADCDKKEQYSVKEIIEEIADGMIDEAMLEVYTTGSMIEGMYDFLVAYYEHEPQLEVKGMRSVLSITVPHEEEEIEEDVVDSDDEAEEDGVEPAEEETEASK